ncbi:hypothetical protein ILUMI_24834 [Ignelater luminosus]|uniref:Potassium channel domain-containing protein n=1 Tax=Ignelater luminosus TaxID=2038154 RepID=A0A8K0CCR7_IGNLU|nr:hypothetical protein ILUMI_24834 [Ignelater luminosus]
MSEYYDPEMLDQPPSTCTRVVCFGWKVITFLFSHIALVTLVIAYCVGGAKMFEKLESEHEIEVKNHIRSIRLNTTDELWNQTRHKMRLFKEEDYKNVTEQYLRKFEKAILDAMRDQGWDGSENQTDIQWTFQGALFYSIIVITTIGYGHIAPKTDWGKVATIFYAILGIPLMLLCLSNVGDILATSFRFLYWKVCCYVCTKKPKRIRRSRSRLTARSLGGRYTRSRTASFRRSMRTSTRSADSGFGLSEIGPSSYSDTDLSRYQDEYPRFQRGISMPRMRPTQQSRYSENTVPKRRVLASNRQPRGGSLDRRREPDNIIPTLEPFVVANTPVLCNKYVVNQREPTVNHNPGRSSERSYQRRTSSPLQGRRAISMPRSQQLYLEPPREPSPMSTTDSLKTRRKTRTPPAYSPRIMSPLGFGPRQHYVEEAESDFDYEDDYYDYNVIRTKPVPIWLCVLLVLSYIIAGMFLFNSWEKWDYLDAAYFCFITLTTIGFGDFVPSSKNSARDQNVSIALCSLYLLFGISLLAMSFNLVQEEVLAHVRRVAKTLGIIKDEEAEEEED